MEILIVVSLIAVLVAGLIMLLNPMKLIGRGFDNRRKQDLTMLKRAFEDFYNDNNHYPLSTDICYDAAISNPNPRTDSGDLSACSCHICGTKAAIRNFTPYMNTLSCDPQSPNSDYLYDFDCVADGASPAWFRIYTKLNDDQDSAVEKLGCGTGCGPTADKTYNFAITSDNIDIEK